MVCRMFKKKSTSSGENVKYDLKDDLQKLSETFNRLGYFLQEKNKVRLRMI